MTARQWPTPAQLGLGKLFAQVRDAVVVSDANGTIVLWNPAAFDVFGYTVEEALGANVRMLVPPAYHDQHDSGMRRFRGTGHGPLIDSGMTMDLPALRKDGTRIVIEMRLSKLASEGDHAMAIVRDVTQRVNAAAELKADRERLREANRALEAFAYVVGHDLKEPVRAVAAYLEALDEHVVDDVGRGHVARAGESIERLSKLLEGLIEWSHATVGGIDLLPVRVDEVGRSSACHGRYQRAVDEHRANVTFEGDFAPVLGTASLLCQIFGNLVLNAIRHNPGPSPRVVVTQEPESAGRALIRVRDNGPGFPEAVTRRLASETGATPRISTSGGGFGLTIARRAAESLGGGLELVTLEGGGGEARVWLSLATNP